MIDEPAPPPLAEGVALLERAITYTLGSLLQVAVPDDLHRPTPCREWNLGALLAHMNDSLAALDEAITVGEVDVRAARVRAVSDPVLALRTRACRLLGEWAGAEDPGVISVAGRPLTTGIVMGAGAIEVAVHGWDVARGCGMRRDVPPSLAAELLDLAPMFVTDADRPGRFDDVVAVPAHSGEGDRLLAFLGRDPG